MKKYLIKILAAVGFSSVAMSANAGIPTFDAVAVINMIISYVAQGEQYAQQIQQYEQQLQQFEKQIDQLTTEQGALNALTGGRGMGSLVNIQGMRQAVPTASFNNLGTLSGAQAALTQTQQQLASAQGRISMLTSLTSAADTTTDAKASADLQARISAENAHLMNENIMIQAAKDNQVALEAVQAQQNRTTAMQNLLGTTAPGFE